MENLRLDRRMQGPPVRQVRYRAVCFDFAGLDGEMDRGCNGGTMWWIMSI